jgi:magnesium chelatase family protein
MLARRMTSILPPLTNVEAIAVTRIHSIAGGHVADELVRRRPFRAPHHTISPAGLVGGGSVPQPGEATLAHHGVLFLDELSEFSRSALESLRQPLEDGAVTIVRAQRTVMFPTRFQLVASTNPCPCGMAGDDRCRCSEADIARHGRKLSGPLLDRMDLHVQMPRPKAEDLERHEGTPSDGIRAAVLEARERQAYRLTGTGLMTNAELVHADAEATRLLRLSYSEGTLSARGHGRILRVARTVADLDGCPRVGAKHVGVALGMRQERVLEGAGAA